MRFFCFNSCSAVFSFFCKSLILACWEVDVPPAAAAVVLAVGLTVAVLHLGNALIELDQQQDIHRALTRAERERNSRNLGIRGYGGSYFGPGSGFFGGSREEGSARVAGLLAFSVCNPETCLIEKEPIAVDIDVR